MITTRDVLPDFRTIPEAANTIGQTQTRVQHPLEVRTPVATCFIRAGPTRTFQGQEPINSETVSQYVL